MAEITCPLGRFRIVRQIGVGLICDVFEIRDADQRFAAKILRWEHRSAGLVKQFLEEGQRLLACSHQNLITGLWSGMCDDAPVSVMELGEGDLEFYAGKGLGINDVLRHIAEVARGIDYLHQSRFEVHGDVKPDNIFLVASPEGAPFQRCAKIGDLGLLRRFDYLRNAPVFARYAAVELLEGRVVSEELRSRADIYSLAVSAAHLLTGELPGLHHRGDPTRLSNLGEGVTAVLLRGMHDQPAERPPTATEFASDLRDAFDSSRNRDFVLPLFRN